jgi:5-methylcytosine-specific restriction endonuclease McrA
MVRRYALHKATKPNVAKLDQIVAQARQAQDERNASYREQSLKIHPWVCARCGRVFTRENLHELTVHHKDHNHDNNPPDGSNWENLCIYCHDNEHARYEEYLMRGAVVDDKERKPVATHSPFAGLQDLLNNK